MVFTSIIFIFAFLPLVLCGNALFTGKRKLQNVFLLIMSLLFYAWGESKYVLLLLFSVLFNWLIALLMEVLQADKTRKLLLAVGVMINFGMLFGCKYMNWGLETLNTVGKLQIPLLDIRLPIGISFYTFQAVSYIVDVYKKKVRAQRSIIDVGLYVSFFPQLVAGPIIRYVDMEYQIFHRSCSWENVSDGIERFMKGFSKKVLLADTFALVADKAFILNMDHNLQMIMAWLGAIAYTLQIYYDFSGYSDMAIGLGKMLGFAFPENFNYPYIAVSFTDFWHRWHISLSTWFRDYLYIPLGGNRKGLTRTILNLAVTWLATGIWHGANLTFLVWGGIYGILIILEKIFHMQTYIEKLWGVKLVYRIYVLAIVIILWVVFRADNLSSAWNYIMSMFGGSVKQQDYILAIRYVQQYWLELIAGVIGATPLFPKLREIGGEKLSGMIQIGMWILFLFSVSYLIKGTYSPFIYFNF